MFQNHPLIKTSTVFADLARTLFKSYITNDIDSLKKNWAQKFLQDLNINVNLLGQPEGKGPLLLLGNHISYIDIPILVYLIPQISFLSKSEIKYWPLIGSAACKMNTVFVKRTSVASRQISKKQISTALLNQQRMIAGFPSGTTCLNEDKPWRHGLFEVAQKSKIPIQPFRISYQPLRSVAYIKKDQFLSHLYKLVQLKEIKVTIEFHEPVAIKDPISCSQYWQKWTRSRPELDISRKI